MLVLWRGWGVPVERLGRPAREPSPGAGAIALDVLGDENSSYSNDIFHTFGNLLIPFHSSTLAVSAA
jgi:hypothetical protein